MTKRYKTMSPLQYQALEARARQEDLKEKKARKKREKKERQDQLDRIEDMLKEILERLDNE